MNCVLFLFYFVKLGASLGGAGVNPLVVAIIVVVVVVVLVVVVMIISTF